MDFRNFTTHAAERRRAGAILGAPPPVYGNGPACITDESSALADFVGTRSPLIFDLVGVSTDFIKEDRWPLTADYHKVKSTLNNISSTNDSAERATALMTTYNTRITRTESSYKEIVQVVEDHRSTFSFSSKKGLRNFH